jgi:hypothetical protein
MSDPIRCIYLYEPLFHIWIEDRGVCDCRRVSRLFDDPRAATKITRSNVASDICTKVEVFVVSIRQAVLSQDIDSCSGCPSRRRCLQGCKLTYFMEMCQGRIQQSGRGHIKIPGFSQQRLSCRRLDLYLVDGSWLASSCVQSSPPGLPFFGHVPPQKSSLC